LVLKTTSEKQADGSDGVAWRPPVRANSLPDRLTEKETEAHKVFIKSFGSEALWNKFSS
jgi:DNA polymerase-3 subunit epsilon